MARAIDEDAGSGDGSSGGQPEEAGITNESAFIALNLVLFVMVFALPLPFGPLRAVIFFALIVLNLILIAVHPGIYKRTFGRTFGGGRAPPAHLQSRWAIMLERFASNPLTLRFLGLLALLLWCAALFAPIHQELTGSPYTKLGSFSGWELALDGWLGPLSLAPGWYANIPFAISLIRCLRGRPPGRWLALIGLAIAATALAPYWASGFMTGFMFRGWFIVRGPALWLWLSAYVLVLILAITARR
jgi:hypothetical protein